MQLRVLILVSFAAVLLLGCSSSGTGYESNPAGAEAKSGKKYTAEEAAAAQPKRGGSEGN